MRSKFEDTRRKALKFGAHGTTVKAYKSRAFTAGGVRQSEVTPDSQRSAADRMT